MSHKDFSFWLCTLLSGVVIGIAIVRIPEAYSEPRSSPDYFAGENPLQSKLNSSSFQIHKARYDASYHTY